MNKLLDRSIINKNTSDEIVDNEYYKSFENDNVFINYLLSVNDDTKYQTRNNNRILLSYTIEYNDKSMEISNVIENDFVEYTQFRIDKYIFKLDNSSNIEFINEEDKYKNYSKRKNWEEIKLDVYDVINAIQDLRDYTVEYYKNLAEQKKKSILYKYGSFEVYENIKKYESKIKQLENEEEINKLRKLIDIAVLEQKKVEDIAIRTFNIQSIKNKL